MSGGIGQLLLDTLRLDPVNAESLRARWADADLTAPPRARAVAAWAAWEDAELWLRRRLADVDVLPRTPAMLREPLHEAAHRAAQAHLAIDEETERVVTALADADVPCVLIKGQARRAALPLWLRDTRRTSDVDILIPADQAERAWGQLRAAQFQPLAPPPGGPPPRSEMWGPSRHHLRPLTGPGGVAVELHVSTSWELPPDVAWERLSTTAREHGWRGLTVRCPCGTELLWHALTHAGVGGPNAWRLRFWLDGATALALEPIDWSLIAERLAGPESPGPAATRWLHAAASLAGMPLPPELSPRPYPLADILQWRVSVWRRESWGRAVREKLLDEATRTEAGISLAPLAGGRGFMVHVRRRLATIAARLGYLLWRAARSSR